MKRGRDKGPKGDFYGPLSRKRTGCLGKLAVNEVIREAIQRRRVVKLFYGGGHRLVEPHCYGLSRDGKELLRAYQISGYSQSGQTQGWKLFRMDRASDISITDLYFQGPRPLYNPQDRAMAHIHCSL